MKQSNELFVKQMTRKEFLQFATLAILGVLGFKNFVTFLLENQEHKRKLTQATTQSLKEPISSGFGSSKFGA